MELFKKYEFDSQEQAESKIAALPHDTDDEGNEWLIGNHTIVKLGHIVTQEGVYENTEDGDIVEVTPPVYADKYSVDVLWRGLDKSPYGWTSYEITVEGNGVHTFLGRNF